MKTTTNSLLFFLFFVPILMFGQNTLTGTVTEQSTSIPLPGVNVVIKNTTTGTSTDFDGNYQIEVNNGDVLVFSYVGYQTIEITYSGQASLNIQLNEDAGTWEVLLAGQVAPLQIFTPSHSSISVTNLADLNITTTGEIAGVGRQYLVTDGDSNTMDYCLNVLVSGQSFLTSTNAC